MRPPRISGDVLRAKLVELRAAGLSHKQVAERLGYSHDYIRELVHKFGLARNKPTKLILTNPQDILLNQGSPRLPE